MEAGFYAGGSRTMGEEDGGWAPLRRLDGYLPIADHGLIGDGQTAALVGRDGVVSWLCVPWFDAQPLFCSLLDRERGGAFSVTVDGAAYARQSYERDTAVLVTEIEGSGGRIRITDALAIRSGADIGLLGEFGRGELVRRVEAVGGAASVRVDVAPRGGADVERDGRGLRLRWARDPRMAVRLRSSRLLDGLREVVDLDAGQHLDLVLRWGEAGDDPEAATLLASTATAWRDWLAGCFTYDGPHPAMVRRSAITLKLCDYTPTGALVAAPTSSLPEAIGGVRNWDYRYAWIRDAAFSVYAFRRIGMRREAWAFLRWVLESQLGEDQRPRVLYDIHGGPVTAEWADPELEGYRGSSPVRWGNAAGGQRQHDVFGELLDCAHQWVSGGGELPESLWDETRALVEGARREWREPDQGIWEVRTAGRVFTYSAALCAVALDRGARLAERLGLPGDVSGWRKDADTIRDAILSEAWDDDLGAITENFGGGGCDASILALPLRRVIRADHPKMVSTTRAIAERLGAGDGLLYRYLPEESPDGLPGHEGAFLLCSFWMADNLAYQGRVDEAHELFESLCSRANHVGLLPEQIDPSDGSFLGNFPQAFSHIGLISTGFNLSRLAPGSG